MIFQDDLLVNAILQEIEDLKVNIGKLNTRILNLEKKYRELAELLKVASK
ncbi:MAG: hypothetical protein FGF53_00485 [Candidatus Brockarchaeota archaeon]|nr:hypothetical protein [Candidatus Brockarchaeota archaeon]MBO3808623.1 hypothetical protein [Candidatus Brockarchaeota archaeon]